MLSCGPELWELGEKCLLVLGARTHSQPRINILVDILIPSAPPTLNTYKSWSWCTALVNTGQHIQGPGQGLAVSTASLCCPVPLSSLCPTAAGRLPGGMVVWLSRYLM